MVTSVEIAEMVGAIDGQIDAFVRHLIDQAVSEERMAVTLDLLASSLAQKAGLIVGVRIKVGFLAESSSTAETAELMQILSEASKCRLPTFDWGAFLEQTARSGKAKIGPEAP